MITAGIDVGNRTTKAVIVEDHHVLSWAILSTGLDGNQTAADALQQALNQAKRERDAITRIAATGAGRKRVDFADEVHADILCDVQGTIHSLPRSVRTIIDMGSEGCIGIKCDGGGKIIDFFTNDRCAAGVGLFLDVAAKMLGLDLEEAGHLSLKSSVDLSLSSSCVVFAQSEVVTLVHAGNTLADVMHAVNKAAAFKASSLARRMGIEPDVALLGGVAKNPGFVACLREGTGCEILIPEEPQIVGALGAALIAQSGE